MKTLFRIGAIAALAIVSIMGGSVKTSAQLTPSQNEMMEACRAGNRSQCWRAHEFVYSKPEKLEAEIRGCELRSIDLCYSAAITYERGNKSIQRSLDLAAKYYKIACDLGDPRSCASLGQLSGSTAQNLALSNLQKNRNRCSSGDAAACNMTGFLLENAPSGTPGKAESLSFYQRGCQLGDKIACRNVRVALENANILQREAQWRAADTAARNDPNRKFGTNLSQSDRACLKDVEEVYYTSERGQCTQYSRLASGSEGCDRYATVAVKRTRFKLKNVCAKAISFQEYCGSTPFGWATLLPGDVYTRQFVSPCRLAY